MKRLRHPLSVRLVARSARPRLGASVLLAAACVALAACGSESDGGTADATTTGGTTTTGGSPETGGLSTGGRDTSTGGTAILGGAPGTGGSGATSSGAGPSGGAPPSGGAGIGGMPSGGAPTGGTAPTGGATPTGGAEPTGGEAPAGGTEPIGGGPPTGGGGTGGTAPLHELVLQEAESGFCSVDGVVESTNTGFSGSGYANTNNVLGAAIEWAVQVGATGSYTLRFTYAHPDADRPGALLVNGSSVVPSLSFPGTSDWSTWSTVTAEVTFVAGENRIQLVANGDGGLGNIDVLTIIGEPVSPVDCVPEPPEGSITIWIAGDSTVANGSTPCPTGWGAFFADSFNDQVTVVNSAVGGRSVRTWLYDVTDQLGSDGECVINVDGTGARVVQARWTDMLAQMSEGDYLFIQFGINDGDSSCPRHVGSQAFQEEYAMMAQAARERGANPVFLTPVSMIRCSGDTPIGSRGFLDETFAVGAQENVPVIDLHQLSVELYTELDFCPIPGGDVSASTTGPVGDFFCDDHTHFSDSGAVQIAEVVANAVADSGLPLAAYLR